MARRINWGSLFILIIVSSSAALLVRNYGAAEASTPSLSCHQIPTIWSWTTSHYGGKSLPDAQTPAFAKRVAESFLTKLDPNRFLILESEANQFVEGAPAGWKQVMQEGNCRYFETFVQKVWRKAEERALISVNAIGGKGLKIKFVELTDDETSLDHELPKYPKRPQSDKEFLARLEEVFQKTVETTSERIRAAYRQDLGAIARESIAETYFGTTVTSQLPAWVTKAMLGAVDKYSTYYLKEEFDDFYQDLAGTVTGIGIRVAKTPDGFLIEKILAHSPAEKHRLKVGDVIVSIDGQNVKGRPMEVARRLLKGGENTWMQLKLARAGQSRPVAVRVQRTVFAVEEARVTAKWLARRGESAALVITVPSFYGRGGLESDKQEHSCAEDVQKILVRQLKKKSFKGPVILDLRGNPGGYLEEAISMGSLFLGDKVVVGVLERGERRILKGSRPRPLYDGPLAVWVDSESASAAEVLSGALKDHARALIVGDSHSYGKGSVQRLFHLSDDFLFFAERGESMPFGVVKLTTSYFFSPLGHNPGNGGVVPHVALKRPAAMKASAAEPETAVKVADTTPFLSDNEVSQLRKRDSQVRDLVKQILTASDEKSERANLPVSPQEEERVARFAEQFAGYGESAL